MGKQKGSVCLVVWFSYPNTATREGDRPEWKGQDPDSYRVHSRVVTFASPVPAPRSLLCNTEHNESHHHHHHSADGKSTASLLSPTAPSASRNVHISPNTQNVETKGFLLLHLHKGSQVLLQTLLPSCGLVLFQAHRAVGTQMHTRLSQNGLG